jgi:hypothetical protein
MEMMASAELWVKAEEHASQRSSRKEGSGGRGGDFRPIFIVTWFLPCTFSFFEHFIGLLHCDVNGLFMFLSNIQLNTCYQDPIYFGTPHIHDHIMHVYPSLFVA